MYLDGMFEGFTKLSDLGPCVRSQHYTAAFIAVVNTRDTAPKCIALSHQPSENLIEIIFRRP